MATKRAVRYTLVALAVLAVVVLGLVLFLTRTGPGVDRAGRFALERLRGAIEGELDVGRITSSGLLEGVTLHEVTLTGPDGRPFLAADSARLSYRLRTLLGGAIAFDRLTVYRPEVVIERLPGDEEWNYERIFPSDTAAPDTARDNLVLIGDATVVNGTILVRIPWEPEGPVAPEDTARLILESAPGGLVRTLRFEALDARAPRIVWEAPDEEGQLIEVSELSTRAYIWETPAEIRELKGVIAIRDSLVSFDAPRARLPSSEFSVVGRVILGEDENQYDVEVDGRDVALADLQWLYPPLPTEGGGNFRFRMQTQAPGSMLWLIRDARVRTPGTQLAGSFGVVTGDTLYFTDVDLQASPLDLDLLQRLVPAELPIEGLLIGTIKVDGPVSALETRGDLRVRTFREGEGAESLVRWHGTVALERPFSARDLEADLRAVDLEQLAQLAPGLRLRGTATGRLRASGSLEHGLDVAGNITLDREGRRSAVRGAGRFAVGGDRSLFDLRFDADPVALELLAAQWPGLGRLAGDAHGPVTVTGSLDSLDVDADLVTPAGELRLQGELALTGPTPRYRAGGAVRDFQLDRLAERLPETLVTGRFELAGEGDTPGTVDARIAVEVHAARVAGVEVRPSTARGAVADGLVRLDSLAVRTEAGTLRASGSFGIVEGRRGELAVSVDAGALASLEPVVFPEGRPATEASEALLAGQLEAQGVLEGSVRHWAARGRASGRGLVYDQLRLAEAAADFHWRPGAVTLDATVDSLSHRSRRVPHARATVEWTRAGGRVAGRVRGVGNQQLDLEGTAERTGGELAMRLGQLDLTTRDGRWAIADTVRVRVRRDGMAVDSLVLLRGPESARIRVAGALPWQQPGEVHSREAALAVDLVSVPVGELLRVTQTDTLIGGAFTGQIRVSGTAVAPVLEGRVTARPFRYAEAVLDSAAGAVSYSDRRARARVAGWKGGEVVVSGEGTVPVELALMEREERLLPAPMELRIRADSVPASLVSFLAPGFEGVAGLVDGELALVGTPQEPALRGRLQLMAGSALFRPLNVHYESMDVTARMRGDNQVELEAWLGTRGGGARVAGALDLTQPRDPGFDLSLEADGLQASRRPDVSGVASGQARLTGRYSRPVVSGDLRIVRGEMNLDEIWRQYQIVQLDSSLFQLFDSTAVRFRPPPEIPFLENMVLTGATVRAERDFWLRSSEFNVEVAGGLDLEVDRHLGDFRLTGTLEVRDGTYALQLVQGVPGRMFEIRGGTIEFVGTPGIDPNLEIDAGYRVRRAQGDPIDVVARVAGTLKDPRVSLGSDSDLPLTESDLASYILFGRSGAELTQAQTDVVSRGLGLVRPVATSMVATMFHDLASLTGVVNYVALTTPEYAMGELEDAWAAQGMWGVLHNTQVEVGIDAGRDLSVVGSVRVRTASRAAPDANAKLGFGARLEYRPWPTWTVEGYVEDRFARTPSFGFTEIEDRKVLGLSLFRDWAY
ncbi:MAG: translocation/assembly module TamB domain-containing protein [Gemmatimonadota bacterium]